MSAASNRERGLRPAWDGRRAAVLVLLLAAACGGGERREGAVATDTAGSAAVSPMDTVAAVMPDTSRMTDGSTDTTAATSAPGSAVVRHSTPEADSAPARRSTAAAPRPAAPARDTARQRPAPARDTASARAPERDTAGGQSAAGVPAPAADTQAPAAAPQAAAPQAAAPPAQDAPMRDQYHQAPRDTVVQAVYDGWKQYNLNCARCHGEDVLGSTIAPHLVTSLKPDGPIPTKEAFVQVVCAGRPEKGMPAWCPLGMEMEKIEQIYSYVKGRSAGEIGPGRPALRQEG